MSDLAFGGFLLLIECFSSSSAVSVAFNGAGLASVGPLFHTVSRENKYVSVFICEMELKSFLPQA